ncbi:MAG TPA: tRNA (adenosine(37)-N6)-threonylcarbamoyltransferase complex ATPase subunit type 1 TsaE [Clostridia bacterium]|nr:tRNA (adenosine(37)-N6)-threonylcarbamoyltransferase complex ATPase subunit type 1 TsaE [Clostridia bacterium]
MQEIVSHSPKETEAAGEKLAALLCDGDIIAYIGGLGMGKTVFTRGLARGLGIVADVSSPTFSIINEYRGTGHRLCHVDAYRLNDAEDLLETGFYDYIDSGWIAAVEWSERVKPDAAVTVAFTRVDDHTRIIRMEGKGL